MANRSLLRSIALQALFEWDFRSLSDSDLESIVQRDLVEFGAGSGDHKFAVNLVLGIRESYKELDKIVEKAARDWPLSQTPIVDRNVLRIGLYELLYSDKSEVPARVAINESIELAKSFGGEKSGKFVNGVLGTIYKELGEPGKDELPKKKRKKWKKKSELTEEEIAELPVKQLVGAVVYRELGDGKYQMAMVHDVFGRWTLSKGGIDNKEDPIEGVKREIKEEMNLDIEPADLLGENSYIATDPEIGNMRKSVKYYLAKALNPDELKVDENATGLDDAKWWHEDDVADLNVYDDILPLIEKSLGILRG